MSEPPESHAMPAPTQRCQCGYRLMHGQDCPECGLPFDRAIQRKEETPLGIASFVSILFVAFGVQMTMCACGHMDTIGFVIIVPAMFLAWWPFIASKNPSVFVRAVTMIAVVIASMAFAKNLADVMWFGHNPLF